MVLPLPPGGGLSSFFGWMVRIASSASSVFVSVSPSLVSSHINLDNRIDDDIIPDCLYTVKTHYMGKWTVDQTIRIGGKRIKALERKKKKERGKSKTREVSFFKSNI